MEKLQAMFVNPFISKSTVNHKNVKYLVEKLPPKGRPTELNRGDYSIFGQRVTDIVGSECAIVYTDFIADVGPILCAFHECGLSCAGYYGEMEPTDRQESYDQWMTGNVQIMIATKAFGLGIDKRDIQHVLRNGVPESLSGWIQEAGRAGRDGLPTDDNAFADEGQCCDVCDMQPHQMRNCAKELEIAVDAIHTIGPRGEVKLSE